MKTMVLIVSSLMILGACSENQLSDAPVTAKAIRFESGIQTKAPVTGAQFGSGAKVGVYTLENTSSTPTWTAGTSHASNNLIMNNIACTTNGNGGLTYEPVQSYKENAKYSFFAYYPYTTAVTAPSAGTSPVLACTFSTTPAD